MVLATKASTTILAPRDRTAYSTRSTHEICDRFCWSFMCLPLF
jgi:hypothetical protein